MGVVNAIEALQAYLGQKVNLVSLTPSVDATALAAGDVAAATEVLANACRAADIPCLLQSLTLLDESDSGVALDIYLLDADVAIGTENSAPNISDANSNNIIAFFSVATGDYKDVGGAKIAFLKNLEIPVRPAAGTRNLYVAIVNGAGTPTFGAATALKMKFGFEW